MGALIAAPQVEPASVVALHVGVTVSALPVTILLNAPDDAALFVDVQLRSHLSVEFVHVQVYVPRRLEPTTTTPFDSVVIVTGIAAAPPVVTLAFCGELGVCDAKPRTITQSTLADRHAMLHVHAKTSDVPPPGIV